MPTPPQDSPVYQYRQFDSSDACVVALLGCRVASRQSCTQRVLQLCLHWLGRGVDSGRGNDSRRQYELESWHVSNAERQASRAHKICRHPGNVPKQSENLRFLIFTLGLSKWYRAPSTNSAGVTTFAHIAVVTGIMYVGGGRRDR